MFSEEDVIYAYTDEQAVEDGVLVDTSSFSKVFTRVTSNLFEKGYEERTVDNLRDLFLQAWAHMKKKGKDTFYELKVELPSGEKERIFCVYNELGSYTLMMPEDY